MTTRRRFIPLTVFLIISTCGQAHAAPVVYSHPDIDFATLGVGGRTSQASPPFLPVTSYDNFQLPATTTITDVHWVGFFANGGLCTNLAFAPCTPGNQLLGPPASPGTINQFTVAFNSNGANGPATLLQSYALSGNANQTQIGTGFYAPDNGTVPVYSYAVDLPTPFVAQAGTQYWLSIQASTAEFPPFWGWVFGTGGDGSMAQDFNGVWTFFGNDQAFDLSAPSTLPEPASLLLLGTSMAGLGLGARWRRRRQQ